ncbi:hypothetical protein Tco_0255979 [Tanacetum coccineum]
MPGYELTLRLQNNWQNANIRWRRVAASGVDEGGVMMRRLRWIGVVAVWRSEMYRVKEMVSDGVGGVVVKKWKGGDEIGGSWLGNLDEGVLGWRWGEGCGGLRGGEVVGGLRRWPESGQIPVTAPEIL